ncbi:MAG: hypothetical protein ABI603_15320 [Acidobacteriota bacterium]
MSKPVRSMGSIRGAGAAVAAALLLTLPAAASAQAPLPATACDAALANPDLHPQPEMPLEDGATAFSYTAGGAFVSGGGSAVRITLSLLFAPGPDATIRLTALDEHCSGGTAKTAFTQTFGGLTSVVNSISYDAISGDVSLNGSGETVTPSATPRFLFVDVWDGELPSTHATHSYLIDLSDPKNPGGL